MSQDQEALALSIKNHVRDGKRPVEAIAIALAEKRKGNNPEANQLASPNAGTTSALSEALGNAKPTEPVIEQKQDLSEIAKLAILNKKKTRTFHQG